jgi:archaeosine-15-forming tRNA-guanine transglycosylase
VADEPRLIIQVPRGGAVERQLSANPPPILSGGEVVVTAGATDAHGQLEASAAGEVVLSVPSPEALVREAEEIRRVLARAGKGVEPLVVVVEAAEELREDELTAIVEAAGHSSRAVILRVIRDG